MTGVSSAPRSSSSTPSVRASGVRRRSLGILGASVALAAFAAVACQSELGDGNASMDPNAVPGFTGVPGPGGNVPPGSDGSQGGINAPGNDGVTNPGDVMNSQSGRNPSITGTGDSGPLVDENGMPLPVDQLPPLQACNTPGPQVLRRLNSVQFRNTLDSVFGEANIPDSNPLNDPLTLGYDVDADDLVVQGLDAQAIGSMAEEIAAAVRQNGGLAQFTNGCTDINNNDCRRGFVTRVGERLSREPLNDERINTYAGLFTATTDDGTPLSTSFDEGAELVISALIQSPYSIYRREIGQQQGAEYVLSQFEVASELSYMLTNSPPDNDLMAAARNNQLGSNEQILAQAERLLATAQAEDVLSGFVTAWLDLDRLVGKVKAGVDISDSLRQAMLEETRELFLQVFNEGGTIGDLFSATYTFMNQELSSFYGLNLANSAEFQQVDISGGVRVPGVLGHASYLAAHALADNSSPVQRAFVVRERLLCNDLPPVPTNLDTNLKPQAADATSRERYATHSSNAVCYNCHQLMDPVGFTFEAYDGYGRFRTTEANKPVDTSGGLPLMDENGPTGVTVAMGSVSDLANYLSLSEQTRACLVNNLSYYAYGIANNTKWAASDKVCTDHFIRNVARTSGNTLKSVMTGILTAP
ncbi:MAG TPA: DUF1592 domain-containing protein, partial [Polyangiaceae bacterium]|nr:DUF1592 domain-containing protein [Polyangiaceae bacterium]